MTSLTLRVYRIGYCCLMISKDRADEKEGMGSAVCERVRRERL